jgi:hypothetical protein
MAFYGIPVPEIPECFLKMYGNGNGNELFWGYKLTATGIAGILYAFLFPF